MAWATCHEMLNSDSSSRSGFDGKHNCSIRQSSLIQVTRHAESTDLQYSLVERAVALGWPRERVELIDEDLGKSGAQAEARWLPTAACRGEPGKGWSGAQL